MSHYYGTVRVAENNLCAHINEFVDEEQTALKHFLMEEHRSPRLRGHHDEHREQVGSQSWPRRIGECHDGAVNEGVHLIVFLLRDVEVVVLFTDFDAQPPESVGNDAEVTQRHVLDAYAVAHHGGHPDERSYLNHVGQQPVFRAMKMIGTDNGEQVGTDAADGSPHAVEQVAELLDIGFTGGIVDSGRAFGEHCRHNDIGRSRDRSLIE